VQSYLAPVPADLQADIDSYSAHGNALLDGGRYAPAFEVFRQLHERLLDRQPDGRRFHKGLPLHQMGLARIRAGLSREGMRWTLLAYLEDVISRAEESQVIGIELNRPAAQNLRLWGMRESELLTLAERVRKRVERDGLIADPTSVFVAERLDRTVERLSERAPFDLRLHLPFIDFTAQFSLPALPTSTVLTFILFAIAAASSAGALWVGGVLQAYWQIVLVVLLVGLAVAAVVALVILLAPGTRVGHVIVLCLRWSARNLVVPIIVAVIAGLAVAYIAWRAGWLGPSP
jgi:hypothetical protein